MGDKGFKPETMRLFVKLDKDGKYHEVEGLSGFEIEEYVGGFSQSETTITINGFNTHVSEDSFKIENEFVNDLTSNLDIDNAIYGVVTPTGFKLLSKRDLYKEHLPKKVIVSGPCVISFWNDGTKTISRCHDGDEMDVRTGILLNAIKKWMPGGTYWQDVMEDVTVEYQGKKEKIEKPSHAPVNHDRPCRPYMRGGRYGDDEKMRVIELIESGMTQHEVSRKTGISQATISMWMKQWRENE